MNDKDYEYYYINKNIATDFKIYGILDEKKFLNNNTIKLLKKAKNINLLKKELTYHDDNELLLHLKNYLRYRICTKLNLYQSKFDCDCCYVAMHLLKDYIEKKDKIEITIKENTRYMNVNGIQYETDTANSIQTLLGIFMRNRYKNLYTEYYKKYKYPKSEVLRDYFFLTNMDKWYRKMKKEDQEVIDKFNDLAKIDHTIGNIVLTPLGFNSIRGRIFKDDYCKSLEYILKNKVSFDIDPSTELFNTITGYDITLEYKNKVYIENSLNNKDMLELLNNMIYFIEKRNEKIKDLLFM